MNLASTALRRPVTTFMVFACFIVIGVISSQLLPLEFLPELDVPYIGIDIPYPGSTPEEIERRITRPAEEVLATISGIKKMESNTWESGTWIGIEFDWGVSTDIKALEAREKLESIRHLFPDDLERFYFFEEGIRIFPPRSFAICCAFSLAITSACFGKSDSSAKDTVAQKINIKRKKHLIIISSFLFAGPYLL